MEEQAAAPSPAPSSSSTPAGKPVAAPKDRACPFCHQPFTSSSLGRHLDLYIKDKNPKPADGVHIVEEIRKMRSGITRRQPRNSGIRKPEKRLWSAGPGQGSPTMGDEARNGSGVAGTPMQAGRDRAGSTPRGGLSLNQVNWEATGVINDIPKTLDDRTASADGEDANASGGAAGGVGARADLSQLHGSRQLQGANADAIQKQKLADALDTARATELALREIFMSLRAASDRTQPISSPFKDFDPLTLDFPSLTLKCLKAPPTLTTSSSPIPSPDSWSIAPPTQQQLEALQNYVREAYKEFRAELKFRPQSLPENDFNINFNVSGSSASPEQPELSKEELMERSHMQEANVLQHLTASFAHWASQPPAQQAHIWAVCMARALAHKADETAKLLEKQSWLVQQYNGVNQQLDQLSRYQLPREFHIRRPETIYVSPDLLTAMRKHFGEDGAFRKIRGFELADVEEDVGSAIDRVVSRWKSFVKENREARENTRAQRVSESVAPQPAKPVVVAAETAKPAAVISTPKMADADADMEDADAPADEVYDAPMDASGDQDATTHASASGPNRQGGTHSPLATKTAAVARPSSSAALVNGH